MMKYKLVQGMQDYLPSELTKKNKIEKKIEKIFSDFGFKAVQTPTLEHHSIFTSGDSLAPFDKLFKFSDTDGNLLVLRSDMTTPISRIVSTKMQADFPLRLSYIANSYKLKVERNRLREYTQAGVELFGVNSPFADAEVIALAIETIKATGLSEFQIDIGQVNILKGFLNTTLLTEEEKKEIISLVDKKNFIEKDLFSNFTSKEREIVNEIVHLFGDSDVLNKAKTFLTNQESLDALDNLNDVYQILKNMGYGDYISFDLGIVNTYTYYTGIVFKGITRFFGSPILSGGRYDTLTNVFDKDIPATGFAIGINDLIQALSMVNGGEQTEDNIVALGMVESKAAQSKFRVVCESIISQGNIVDFSYKNVKESLLDYAKVRNIKKVIFINKEGATEEETL